MLLHIKYKIAGYHKHTKNNGGTEIRKIISI